MRHLRKRKHTLLAISLIVTASLFFQMFMPPKAYGIGGGPSQPETQTFSPAGADEMVNLFTGDFTYNIPLIDVGGYPINMSYNSGISMDQEASWVGLGWNINPGSITRNLRGLPDDFNGDMVKKTMNKKANETYGVTLGAGFEFMGTSTIQPGIGASLGAFYNNYKGLGFEYSLTPSLSASKKGSRGSGSLSLDLSGNSQSGVSVSPSLSFSAMVQQNQDMQTNLGLNLGAGYNSRAGLKEISFNSNVKVNTYRPKLKFKDYGLGMGPLPYVGKEQASSTSVFNGGATRTFNNSTYYPSQALDFDSKGYTFNATVGGELWGGHANGRITGYYSIQELVNNKQETPAYGYMHLENGMDKKKVLLDFNREKDVPYSKNSKYLPLTNLTFDQFSISGQGLGGMFRPHRNDVGYVFDGDAISKANNKSGGVEVGLAPNTAHGGGNYTVVNNYSRTGKWKKANDALNTFTYRGEYTSEIGDDEKRPLYEKVYFKNLGEKTPVDQSYYDNYGGDKPVKLDISEHSNYEASVSNEYKANGGGTYQVNKNYRTERVTRNQSIRVRTASEVKNYGNDASIYSYEYVNGSSPIASEKINFIERVSDKRKGHHMSSIEITKPDGWRYQYDIPAYNNSQHEVTLNVGDAPNDCSTGIVNYDPSDNSVDNDEGLDNYYSKKEIPPYAHSFLISSVLSPDYVDVGQDGPSKDDLGEYVNFKYTRVHDNYKWRMPMHGDPNHANFNEGRKSLGYDNKGNYVYGTKEVWYVHKVASKTHVASFHISPRADATEADGPDGGIGNKSLMKLDSIQLYLKQDIKQQEGDAVPIKTVHFEYDYSLCPNLPSNPNSGPNNGKLTLKEVYFTYGNSEKGKLNGYKFHYGDTDHDGVMDFDDQDEDGTKDPNEEYLYNPSYNYKGNDRWGNYKPNNTECELTNSSDPMPNADFPYVNQDNLSTQSKHYSEADSLRSYADVYAQAWHLTTIEVPSGGQINVDYEADEYAYVQDKRAMQMFKVIGMNNTTDMGTMSNELYTGQEQNDYVFFELMDADTTSSPGELRDKYLDNMERLYFKFLTHITDGNYEYVPGYCTVLPSESGFIQDNGYYRYGYVKVDKVGKKTGSEDEINPILKTALQFTRLQLSDLVYPGSNPIGSGNNQFKEAIKGLGSLQQDVTAMFTGFNTMLMTREFCKEFVENKSFIRLYNPNYHKKGGGSRVKRITRSDQWDEFVGEQSEGKAHRYGKEYIYEKVATVNGTERTISSGVASYEPLVGGDENPFRMPEVDTVEKTMAPDNRNYVERPFGESFFPGARVGYSKVKIQNLQYEDVNDNATGFSIHEYFTSKDFPTKTRQTGLEAINRKSGPLDQFVKGDRMRLTAASQGYVVELNDMHGKPKSKKKYARDTTMVSGTEYYYKLNENNNEKLSNQVSAIEPDGSESSVVVGKEMEIVNDFRSVTDKTSTQTFTGNVEFFVTPWPIPVPTFWTTNKYNKTNFRSAVTTKVIQNYALLEKTVAYDYGSKTETKNKYYDSETGDVLVKQTENEFEDDVYTMTYPAHWGYRSFENGTKNLNVRFEDENDVFNSTSTSITNGEIKFSFTNYSIHDYFSEGDVVLIEDGSSNPVDDKKFWVVEVTEGSPSIIKVVDENGQLASYSNFASIEVIRSGRQNAQANAIGKITAMEDPVSGGLNSVDDVIFASAKTFDDKWQNECHESRIQDINYNCSYHIEDDNFLINNMIATLDDLAKDYKVAEFSKTPLGEGTNYPVYDLDNYTPPEEEYWQAYDTSGFVYGRFSDSCTIRLNAFDGVWYKLPKYELGYYKYDGTGNAYSYRILQTINSISNPRLIHEFPDKCPVDPFSAYLNVDVHLKCIDTTCPLIDDPTDIDTFYIDTVVNGQITTFDAGTCFHFSEVYNNEMYDTVSCGNPQETVVNPYLNGIRARWKTKREYNYRSDREYNNNMREDGTISQFSTFWKWNGSGDIYADTAGSNWIYPEEVTKISPHGNEIETRDILGRYSSAVFGYENKVPISITKNSEYRESGYQGFEDYDFNINGCYSKNQLEFVNIFQYATDEFAHTGNQSLRIDAGLQAHLNTMVRFDTCSSTGVSYPYSVDNCDCLVGFTPGSDQGPEKYVMSFWYREDQTASTVPDHTEPEVTVDVAGSPVSVTTTSKSKIIEKWQKIEVEFTIPQSSYGDNIDIEIKNPASNNFTGYIDDVRIHPFNSTMKSYVYDRDNLRLKAEMDANNYATFYEYDQEGNLVRVKKETEEGIMTIKESRQHKHIQRVNNQ